MMKTRLFSVFLTVLGVILVTGVSVAADEEKKTSSTKPDTPSARSVTKAPPAPSPYQGATRSPSKQRADGESVVITNDYLEEMMSGLTPEQKLQGVYQAERHIGEPPPGAKSPDQATQGAGTQDASPDPQTGAETGAPVLDEQPKTVDELNAKITELERRLLALKNPLLPRRYSDKTNEDSEDWDAQDHLQKIATTEEELAELRAELAAAQNGRHGSR